METDLSLIEISGEDDSLLHQIPTLDDSTATTTAAAAFFSCSPLQISRSNSISAMSRASPNKRLKDSIKAAKPSFSSPSSSSNKENMNMHRTEVPKLSLEPQSMKRKKKGGGYNIRKSLAWDRAFFTEEGVLDSQELSLLSGNFSQFSGEVLSIIHEEGGNLSSDESNCASDSANNSKVFKRFPMSSPNKDRENGGSSLLKHNSSAQDNVTPKVHSNQRNRTGSRGRICPRPLPLSSLKRPANESIMKIALKESKLPRIPVSKPSPRSVPTTSKNTTLNTRHSKHNQIAQSDNVQKNAGLKFSSRSTKCVPNKVKSGPGCFSLSSKSLPPHPKRNAASSTLEIYSATNQRPPLVNKSSGASVVIPDRVLPALDGHNVSTKTGVNSHDVSTKTGAFLPQNSKCAGGNTQYSQLGTAKPSGLRMPSQSLGFFSQPKSSSSLGATQRPTQSSNLGESSIPRLWKPGASNENPDLRPPHAPGKIPKILNDSTARGDSRISGSSKECSALSAVTDALAENTKLCSEANHVQMVEVKGPSNRESFEEGKNNKEMQNTIDDNRESEKHGEPFNVEQMSNNIQATPQKNESGSVSQSKFHDQFTRENNHIKENNVPPEWRKTDESVLEIPKCTSQHSLGPHVEGAFGTSDTTEYQYLEDREYDSLGNGLVVFECQYGNCIDNIKQDSLITHDDSLGVAHDVNEHSNEPAELANPSTNRADEFSLGTNHCPETNDGTSFEDIMPFEESHKYDGGNIAEINLKPATSSMSELEIFLGQYRNERTDRQNRDGSRMGNMNDKSQSGDVILLSESSNSGLSSLAVRTQFSQITHELLSNDCLLLEENVPSEEPRELNAFDGTANVVSEGSDDCGSEPKDINIFQEPSAMFNGGITVDVMVEQPCVDSSVSIPVEIVPLDENHCGFVEDCIVMDVTAEEPYVVASVSGSVDMFPLVENNCGSVERQFSHDVKLSSEATLEFDLSSNQCSETDDGTSFEDIVPFEESQNCDGSNIADINLKPGNSSELEIFLGQYQNERTDRQNRDGSRMGNLNDRSQSGDDILLSGSSNSGFSFSAVLSECPQITDELLSDRCLLLDNVPSEEPRELNALEGTANVVLEGSNDCGGEPKVSNIIIAQEPSGMFNGGITVDVMVEQPYVESSVSGSVGMVPLAEKNCEPVERRFRHDIKLSPEATSEFELSSKMNRDWRTGFVTSDSAPFCSLSRELGSLSPSTQLKSNVMVDEGGTEVSSDNPLEENQEIESNNLVLFENRSFKESQTGDLDKNVNINPEFRDTPEFEWGSSHKPSQLRYIVQSTDGEVEVDAMSNEAQVGDAKFDGNLLVVNCNLKLSISREQVEPQSPCIIHEYVDPESTIYFVPEQSQVHGSESKSSNISIVQTVVQHDSVDVDKMEKDPYVEDAPSGSLRIELSKENHECKMFCERASEDNHGLQVNDNLMLGNNSSSEELQEDLDSVEYVVSEDCNVYGSELTRYDLVASGLLAIQDNGSKVGKLAEDPHVNTLSDSVEIEASAEISKYTFIDTPLTLSKDQSESVVTATEEFCSTSGELSLSGESVQILLDEGSILGVGVDGMKCISSDGSEDKISPNVINCVDELHGELGNITCHTEDEAATAIEKSEHRTKQDHPMTKPPINAIPFSDEWLAAMEAAGEDILSMKSGAVQNSPPEKSEHEPSPWSPVKRKNVEIGPFDCTKFSNVPPSNSP